MSTDATMQAGEIVTAAMQELGIIAAGEVPTPADMALGLRTLNWMLKTFQARGANLWRQTNGEIVIPAGEAAGTLPQGLQDVSNARVAHCGYSRPLFRYERSQYMDLPNKCAPGVPTIYYLDHQRDAANIYVWPVPSTDTTILLDYVRHIEDVGVANQQIDLPQEWTETVYVALAGRLAPAFGVARLDPAAAQFAAQRAASMEALMLDMDRPSSYFMGAA